MSSLHSKLRGRAAIYVTVVAFGGVPHKEAKITLSAEMERCMTIVRA
jgi:hypothetical protein